MHEFERNMRHGLPTDLVASGMQSEEYQILGRIYRPGTVLAANAYFYDAVANTKR